MTETRLPTAEELLSHARWVRSLLRDALPAHAVDDAMQETWTRAMNGVPGSRAALRPWLRTVSRRVASSLRRAEGTRRERERRDAPAAAAAAAGELVEKLDLHQHVTRAVRRLPEPYRTVVLLRYYEEVPVAEIARRMQTSEDNVYARLARARVMIRERMPEDVRVMVPLVLLPRSSRIAMPALVGAIAMTGISAVFWWPTAASTPPMGVQADALMRATPSTAVGSASAAGSSPAGVVAADRQAAEPTRSANLAGEFSGAPSRPGWTIRVDPVPRDARLQFEQDDVDPVLAVLDATGQAVLADARPGRARLQLQVSPGLTYERDCSIQPLERSYLWQLGTAVVSVDVHDLGGSLAAGAFVWLSSSQLRVRGHTDVDGHVRLPYLPAGTYQLYASIERGDEKVMEEVRRLSLDEGSRQHVVFGSALGMPQWRGRLRTVDGDLVTGAAPGRRAKLILTHEQTRALTPVFVASDGAFEVRLAPGDYLVLASPPSYHGAYHRATSVRVSSREVRQDVILAGCRVRIVVDRPDGQPVTEPFYLIDSGDPRRRHETVRRQDGAVVFDGVDAGDWSLESPVMASPRSIQVVEGARFVSQTVVLR